MPSWNSSHRLWTEDSVQEIEVEIGGRKFAVTCHEGEDEALRKAAVRLDREAEALVDAMGRIPESRMLLLAGLMLADKVIACEETSGQLAEDAVQDAKQRADLAMSQLRTTSEELTRAKVRIADLQTQLDAERKRTGEAGQTEGSAAAALERTVELLEKAADTARR